MTDPSGHQFNCIFQGVGTIDLLLFNADSVADAQKYASQKTSTVPRDGVASKGKQVAVVQTQIDIDAAGLTGKSQAEIDAYSNKAVSQILADVKANLTG